MANDKTKRFMCPSHWSLEKRLEHRSIPEPNSGCILWCDATSRSGYGNMKWQGRWRGSHQLAWEAANGPVPAGLMVLHSCDVRSCINPRHLRVGTAADNSRDKDLRGRGKAPGAPGEKNGRAKLTDSQVIAIKQDCRAAALVAKEHGVKPETINAIRRSDKWRHLTHVPVVPYIGQRRRSAQSRDV